VSTAFGGGARDPRNAARRSLSRRTRRVRVPVARRSAAAITLFIAGTVLLTSSFTAWWVLGVGGLGIGFYPGDDLGGSITEGKQRVGATTYQHAGLGSIAAMYELVLGLVLFMTVLAVIAGIVGLGAERGLLRGRARGSGVGSLGLFVFLLAVLTVVSVGVAQPGQLHNNSLFGYCTALEKNNSSSPCHSFYGSTSLVGVPITWGPSYGFYATIFGGILALGAAITWWSAREEPWEEEVSTVESGPRPKFSTARPIPLTDAARRAGNGRSAASPGSGGTYSTRRAYASARFASASQTRATTPTPRASGSSAGGPATVTPATPAPEPVGEPPVDLSGGSEVDVIVQLKAKLDAGLLSPDEYTQWKRRMLAIPPEAFPPMGGSGAPPHEALQDLDRLRDAGAISGPEYLQLRRRLLLRA
jgi:hypothetical protein